MKHPRFNNDTFILKATVKARRLDVNRRKTRRFSKTTRRFSKTIL